MHEVGTASCAGPAPNRAPLGGAAGAAGTRGADNQGRPHHGDGQRHPGMRHRAALHVHVPRVQLRVAHEEAAVGRPEGGGTIHADIDTGRAAAQWRVRALVYM